jgi:hypothetical protein
MRWSLVFALLVGRESISPAAPASGAPYRDWTADAALYRGVTRDVSLVLSHDAAAPTSAVCAAPLTGSLRPDAGSVQLARRGGVESVESIGGLAIWCTTVPANELPFALWLADHRLRGASPPGTPPPDPESDGSAEIESFATARALSLEGAAGGRSLERPPVRVLSVAGAASRDDLGGLGARDPGAAPEAASTRPHAWSLQQDSERLSVVEGAVTAPAVRYAWVVPAREPQDRALAETTARILGGSAGARLPRLLVPRGLARHARSSALELDGGALVSMWLELSSRGSVDRTRRFADGTVKQLRLVGPSARELERVRATLRLEALRDWENPERRARRLAWYELTLADAGQWLAEVRSLDTIRVASVKRFAHEHLVDARRSTVEVYPPSWPTDDPAHAHQQLYTAAQGDTLDAVARRFHVDPASLARANDLDPKSGLAPGQPLWIPPE